MARNQETILKDIIGQYVIQIAGFQARLEELEEKNAKMDDAIVKLTESNEKLMTEIASKNGG